MVWRCVSFLLIRIVWNDPQSGLLVARLYMEVIRAIASWQRFEYFLFLWLVDAICWLNGSVLECNNDRLDLWQTMMWIGVRVSVGNYGSPIDRMVNHLFILETRMSINENKTIFSAFTVNAILWWMLLRGSKMTARLFEAYDHMRKLSFIYHIYQENLHSVVLMIFDFNISIKMLASAKKSVYAICSYNSSWNRKDVLELQWSISDMESLLSYCFLLRIATRRRASKCR